MSAEPNPNHFSRDQAETLASVLDLIIPRSEDGRLPGAGELGLAEYVDQVLLKTPDVRPLIAGGLEALEHAAQQRASHRYSELEPGARRELLDELATWSPGFVPTLVLHTYAGYYQNARVLEALGREARPPYPKGYAVAPSDFALLEPVRRRTRLYREV